MPRAIEIRWYRRARRPWRQGQGGSRTTAGQTVDRYNIRSDESESLHPTRSFRNPLVENHPHKERERVSRQQLVRLVNLTQMQAHTLTVAVRR